VVVFSSGTNEVHLGVPMNISAGIESGATWDAPAQSVDFEYVEQGAAAIAFFVAEAFPSGSEPWKADLVQVRQQAVSLALKPKAKS